MNRILIFFAIAVLTATLATKAQAASALNGKNLYKEICQKCHIQGGEAGVMGPSDKKREEWKTFFNEGTHSARPEVWEKLTRKKRKDLLLFFLNYAIDSEAPAECG